MSDRSLCQTMIAPFFFFLFFELYFCAVGPWELATKYVHPITSEMLSKYSCNPFGLDFALNHNQALTNTQGYLTTQFSNPTCILLKKHRHRRNVTSHHFFDNFNFHHYITLIQKFMLQICIVSIALHCIAD